MRGFGLLCRTCSCLLRSGRATGSPPGRRAVRVRVLAAGRGGRPHDRGGRVAVLVLLDPLPGQALIAALHITAATLGTARHWHHSIRQALGRQGTRPSHTRTRTHRGTATPTAASSASPVSSEQPATAAQRTVAAAALPSWESGRQPAARPTPPRSVVAPLPAAPLPLPRLWPHRPRTAPKQPSSTARMFSVFRNIIDIQGPNFPKLLVDVRCAARFLSPPLA